MAMATTHWIMRFSGVHWQLKLPESRLPGAWKTVHREVLLHGICWEAALRNAKGGRPQGMPFSRTHWWGGGTAGCLMHCWLLCTTGASREKHTGTKPGFSPTICWVLSNHLLTTLNIVLPEKGICLQGPSPIS